MQRFVKDLGVFALDRPVSSCRFATSFCHAHCYNRKMYRAFRGMQPRDVKNEAYWQSVTPEQFAQDLDKKRLPTQRFRFATRGEMLTTVEDVQKVRAICCLCPDTVFWLPTRSWRDPDMRRLVEQTLMPLKNLRLQASLDPSNTREEYESLVASGWSTMFFGNNEQPLQDNPVKCRKTWTGAKGVCRTCRSGCFNKQRRDVWLKTH